MFKKKKQNDIIDDVTACTTSFNKLRQQHFLQVPQIVLQHQNNEKQEKQVLWHKSIFGQIWQGLHCNSLIFFFLSQLPHLLFSIQDIWLQGTQVLGLQIKFPIIIACPIGCWYHVSADTPCLFLLNLALHIHRCLHAFRRPKLQSHILVRDKSFCRTLWQTSGTVGIECTK